MKKTYIMPEALTVELGTQMRMMTGSMPGIDNSQTGDPGDVDVKEQAGLSDVNLWDEEW